VVTHILRQARRIADHIIFMYLGDVIEQGPAEFFNNPQNGENQGIFERSV
jgi:phosphate transport system ATP-binding protein